MTAIRTWSGVIAFLNTVSVDGRILEMDTLPLVRLPLPLMGPAAASVCVSYRIPIGWVEDVTVNGNEVHADGTVDLDLLDESMARQLLAGDYVGAAIDVHGTVTKELIGKDLKVAGLLAFTQATLGAVTLGDNPAWTRSRILLDPA